MPYLGIIIRKGKGEYVATGFHAACMEEEGGKHTLMILYTPLSFPQLICKLKLLLVLALLQRR